MTITTKFDVGDEVYVRGYGDPCRKCVIQDVRYGPSGVSYDVVVSEYAPYVEVYDECMLSKDKSEVITEYIEKKRALLADLKSECEEFERRIAEMEAVNK